MRVTALALFVFCLVLGNDDLEFKIKNLLFGNVVAFRVLKRISTKVARCDRVRDDFVRARYLF